MMQPGSGSWRTQQEITTGLRRVPRELADCKSDVDVTGVFAALCDGGGDLSRVHGVISGPVGTPYEGGTFLIDITLPSRYPFEPPEMYFLTKVWHPNIDSRTGKICVDILKEKWSPSITLKTALLSLQLLLSDPMPRDPLDPVVSFQYVEEYEKFVQTATYWTQTFAKTTSVAFEVKVHNLVEMGFPEEVVRRTLNSINGNESLALKRLMPSG